MEPNHFEALRARLEEQLRADIELLQEAHRVKLRAFETVWRTQAEVAQMQTPPPPVATAAPAEPADTGNRTGGWTVLFSIQEKMDQIPEVFDKNDVAAALGFMPKRATLFRALDELRLDGWIQDESPSEGRRPARYRKLAQPDSHDD
ncbi:MAG TPA: hypothetical protein VGK45_05445 [Thermoanaerobaculia bacterium]|jgi:hypothetical protein